MAAFLWMGDITRIPADAVVNAANSELTRQPGICDAIFQAAGESALRHACAELGHCPIGHAPVFVCPRPTLFMWRAVNGTEVHGARNFCWDCATRTR